MYQAQTTIAVQTEGAGLFEVTDDIRVWASHQEIKAGMLTVFCRHTSASLIIQENADGDVMQDLFDFFERLVPSDKRLYRHSMEGADDMPAHIKSALTNVSLSIPVHDGQLALGVWQGIYLFEHRTRPHKRSIMLHLIGE